MAEPVSELERATSAFYESLGVPRLVDTIELGRLVDVVTAEELEFYLGFASTAQSAPAADRMAIRNHHEVKIAAVLTADERLGYVEVDGEPALRDRGGDVVLVTDWQLRHWEWMAALVTDDIARRLLDAVPVAVRRHAEIRVAELFEEQFQAIVSGLE